MIFNNDFLNNKISDKNSAINHFKNHGYKEDRLYSNYHYLLYMMLKVIK